VSCEACGSWGSSPVRQRPAWDRKLRSTVGLETKNTNAVFLFFYQELCCNGDFSAATAAAVLAV
jgi:hypothetical protein